MMLEAAMHPLGSLFCTLTYSDENLPPGGNLVPRDGTLWLKRLRKRVSPLPIRYYLCGEYGDQTDRPHFHAAVFGLPPTQETIIKETWGLGNIHVGDLTHESATYITGYISKGRTKRKTTWDKQKLRGKTPEFSRMSTHPGIGALAIPSIASSLHTRGGAMKLAQDGDVPMELKHNKRTLPLGRYLTQKLRHEIGMEKETPAARREARIEEMRTLRETVGLASFPFAVTDNDKAMRNEHKAQLFMKTRKL